MAEETITMKMRGRPLTADEASKSIQRLINSHFHNKDGARCQIPVSAADDDVIAADYVIESRDRISELEAVDRERIVNAKNLTASMCALQTAFDGAIGQRDQALAREGRLLSILSDIVVNHDSGFDALASHGIDEAHQYLKAFAPEKLATKQGVIDGR